MIVNKLKLTAIIKYSFILLICNLFYGCYKDKGNYSIDIPHEPIVQGLDTVYEVRVGDSLIIKPKITGVELSNLSYDWQISAPEAIDPEVNHYRGATLRLAFGLGANRYKVRFTISNHSNNMKYFHDFYIQGITEFSKGSLVLSNDKGVGKLTFIKPDNSILPNIYEIINNEVLPSDPLHIIYANHTIANTPLAYWYIGKHGGVRMTLEELKKEKVKPGTLKENFFLPPENIDVGDLQMYEQGVLLGVIDGKFYGGATSTWNQSNTYGMFGTPADGNYVLAPKFIVTKVQNDHFITAYERNKRQFVRINLYGGAMYFGTQYSTVGAEVFDPTNVKMDLIQMVQINSSDIYAYMKDDAGKIYELKFKTDFVREFKFEALQKKLFSHSEWIHADTKMVASRVGYIYIAYQDKVFRYNPLNEQVQELQMAFKSTVTLLKFDESEETLIVGAGGSLYYLAVQVGKNGELIKKIDGIPGDLVDITWRK